MKINEPKEPARSSDRAWRGITTFCLLMLCIAGFASGAFAQSTNLLFGTDFEGTGINDNLTSSYGYAYAGGNLGNAVSAFTGGITPDVGVTNSLAFDGMPDFTGTASDPNYTNSASYTYSGTDDYIQFGAPLNPVSPTSDLSSLVLSFDAEALGLDPSVTNTTLFFNQLNITTNGVTAVQFTGGSFTIGSNFTHFDVPLSQLTLQSGSIADLTNAAEVATIDGLVTDFRVTEELGTIQKDRRPVWGFDANNQLIVDNIYLRQVTGTVLPPLYERLLWQVNFDDQKPDNVYGFVFRDGPNFATTSVTTNDTDGIGGSAALTVTADLSSWATNPPVSYSGFGPGVGHSIPYTLTNTNKSGYRVYWSAKAGGLLDGVTSAPGNASIQFLVPPGTLTPSNSTSQLVLELAPNVTLTTNYTSFVFDGSAAPIGIYNGGSQAMFNQYISKVNLIQVQAQYNGSPDIGTLFGYDADNTMSVDNVKVVEIVQGVAPPSIVASNGVIKVYFTDPINSDGTTKLQSAANVTGPYTDVPGETSGAKSPYTVPAGSSQLFFRTQWVP